MRSLFLALLLANLIVLAAQFDVVRDLVTDGSPAPRPAQLNAERLRVIREPSTPRRARAEPAPAPAVAPEP